MPKRIVDGEALWGSDKLLQVEPESFRAEFANLVPLALANGSFECDPRKIWSRVYSYNRPSITLEIVVALLNEFERVKMLFRWTEPDGKVWGTWVGSNRPGRLPKPSDIKKGEKVGAEVPQAMLQEFLAAPQGRGSGGERAESGRGPGEVAAHGFGSGFGKGSGSGSAHAGGAGGRAPASETPKAPRAKAPELSSLLEDNCKSKEHDNSPSPAMQAVAVSAPIPDLTPTSTPEPTPEASPVAIMALTPAPTSKTSPATLQRWAVPAPCAQEPFDALDFAMEHQEPFAGLDPHVLRRVVFYHWKIARPFWSLPQQKVDSPARLEQALPKMLEQLPPDFKVPGSATLLLPHHDPNCTECGGSGLIPARNEAYQGELQYLQGNPCTCVTCNTKPWKTWKKEAAPAA